jgi:hypothetical protein
MNAVLDFKFVECAISGKKVDTEDSESDTN